MSAEVLRRAASAMRVDNYPYPGETTENAAWLAVADFLDAMVIRTEEKIRRGGNEEAVWLHERHALNIARAYFGGDD